MTFDMDSDAAFALGRSHSLGHDDPSMTADLRREEIARIAAALRMTAPSQMWPVRGVHEVSDEAFAQMLYDAGIRSQDTASARIAELERALDVLHAAGRTTLPHYTSCKSYGVGLGGGSRSGYECTCGRDRRQAIVRAVLSGETRTDGETT